MTAARCVAIAAVMCFAAASMAQTPQVSYVDEGGIRYQVTRQTVQRQVPVTEMRDQQQTWYRQQVTTDNLQQQQLYNVPVTQYQLVSRLHGRWNPFITPYWTHHYEPVTTWTQQVGTVQIPVSRVAWAPETRTVQAPVTTYRTANEEVISRVAIGPAPLTGGTQQMMASSAPTTPTATLAPRPGAATAAAPAVASATASTTYGGSALTNDPPRQGWQPPSDSRYSESVRR
jgi:hypothetical protein